MQGCAASSNERRLRGGSHPIPAGSLDAARARRRGSRGLNGSDVLIIEMLAGDLAAAEREVRADYLFLEQQGETFFLASLAALLARVVREQGRYDDALALTKVAEDAAAEDDFDAQILWRAVRAPIVARAGQHEEADQLVRTALEFARRTDDPMLQVETLFERAVVQHLCGKLPEAQATLREASAICEAKGNRAALARLREWSTQAFGA